MPQNISYTHITSILLKQINKIRNDPSLLLPILQQRLNKYDQNGNYYPLSGLNFSVKTKQGKKGVQNLIQFIKKQRQTTNLEWSYQLHQAADKRCHFLSTTQEQSVFNRIANLQIGQLVSQFTTWKGQLVQLTFYGFIQPRQYICQLLLQDGRQQKQNRTQFFNRLASYVGIGINTHEKYRFVIVLIMAMQVASHEPITSLRNIRQDSIRQSSTSNRLIRRGSLAQNMRQSGTNMRSSHAGSNRPLLKKNSSVDINVRDSNRNNAQPRSQEAPNNEQNLRSAQNQPNFQAPIYSPAAVQAQNSEQPLECRIEDCLIY